MRIPIIAVVGPTASGKTALAVRLAQRFDGEIISADSMQIYRGMDIASAKPDEAEKGGIPHHLMDFLDPGESFSVARFCELAHPIAADIHSRLKLPIICGGTGLFIDSMLSNTDFSENHFDPELREELTAELERIGVDGMLEQIRSYDPDSFERLKVERNPRRILRCVEIYRLTGRTQTEINREAVLRDSPYDALRIGLKAEDRQFLYDRINARVDEMVRRGLIEEARDYLSRELSDTSSMAIGCKELKPYFDGASSLEECIDSLKTATRRYAKRQLTWFLRNESTHWFDIDIMTGDEIFAACEELIEGYFYERK